MPIKRQQIPGLDSAPLRPQRVVYAPRMRCGSHADTSVRALFHTHCRHAGGPIGCRGGTTAERDWLRRRVHPLPMNADNGSCRWQTRGAGGRACEAEGAQGGRRACIQRACAFFFSHLMFSSPHPLRRVIRRILTNLTLSVELLASC